MVSRPVAADWLQLRRAADHQARENAAGLIDRLSIWLSEHLEGDQPAAVVDLGAGTGSNQAWLAPRLEVAQHWTLLDHDAALLDSSTPGHTPQVVDTSRVVGSVDQLPQLLPADGPALVTCAALLDVLTPREATLIAETIAASQAAAVLSLTVTGEVSLTPHDPFDAAIAAAFDAHQRRDGLLGPDAARYLAAALRHRGAPVEIAHTDWLLDASQPELVKRYLAERVQAAVEQDSALSGEAHQWLQRRAGQLRSRELTLRVGHHDVVSIPLGSPAAPTG